MSPPIAVIMVQRKAAGLSPALAARTPSNIVKLLVTRMKVINIALRTVGENLKGVGQFGLPFRRNPYATRTAAKVAASAMMKSHIAIFFAGTENAGAVSVPTGCPGKLISAWLTTPPSVLITESSKAAKAGTARVHP